MTPDTKELFTLAAKAVGIERDNSPYNGGGQGNDGFDMLGRMVLDWHNFEVWAPLTDDGDSARLRTVLEISVQWAEGLVEVSADMPLFLGLCEYFSDHSGDKNAALRAATLKLAAEIGRRMP